MSLVNEVLRDLHSRKRSAAAHERRLVGVLGPARESRRPPAALAAGIAAAGIAVGLVAGFLYFHRGAEAIQAPEPASLIQSVPEESRVAAVAPPAVSAPEPVAVVELQGLDYQRTRDGFRLALPASAPVDFEVTSRSSYGINVLVRGAVFADAFSSAYLARVEGLGVYPVKEGINLNLELARDAEFQVYGRSMEGREELVIDVVQADAPAAEAMPLAKAAPRESTPTAPSPIVEAPAGGVQPPRTDDREIRTLRAPSFAERDRETSQLGVRMAQRGQLLEAYDILLGFIGENPGAHVSRETLATILLAQQEYGQAADLVRDGLALAPNYAPYKKLQARLLIREGRIAEALALLQQAPPAFEEDPEYFDLMASLRQQTGDHHGAIAAYQRLLASDPGQARWWVALAISLEAVGRPAEALASYQKAVAGSGLDLDVRQYSLDRINNLKLQP